MSIEALDNIWQNEELIKRIEQRLTDLQDEDSPDVRKLRLELEYQKGWLACLHHIAENMILQKE